MAVLSDDSRKQSGGPAKDDSIGPGAPTPTPPTGPPEKSPRRRRRLILAALALAAAGIVAWLVFGRSDVPEGFARGNGRIEANEVFVATKYPGRIAEVLFDEGDTVEAGQVVARMDTATLEAQLRQAIAQTREAESNLAVARAQVQVKQAEFTYASQQYARSRDLVRRGAISGQESEIDLARRLSGQAELAGARASVQQSTSAIEAAKAEADRLRAEIADSVLKSPIRARVQTRLAEPGEVLEQGGRVFSLVDLSDVYMYVFLPERVTGRIPLGSEARIVLDAAPQYPIDARVSFVSPTAQFTPKSVETEEERHNLTFRVRLQIDRERLRRYEPLVKSGLPGVGYVRVDQNAQWPASLRVREVPANLWTPSGGVRQ